MSSRARSSILAQMGRLQHVASGPPLGARGFAALHVQPELPPPRTLDADAIFLLEPIRRVFRDYSPQVKSEIRRITELRIVDLRAECTRADIPTKEGDRFIPRKQLEALLLEKKVTNREIPINVPAGNLPIVQHNVNNTLQLLERVQSIQRIADRVVIQTGSKVSDLTNSFRVADVGDEHVINIREASWATIIGGADFIQSGGGMDNLVIAYYIIKSLINNPVNIRTAAQGVNKAAFNAENNKLGQIFGRIFSPKGEILSLEDVILVEDGISRETILEYRREAYRRLLILIDEIVRTGNIPANFRYLPREGERARFQQLNPEIIRALNLIVETLKGFDRKISSVRGAVQGGAFGEQGTVENVLTTVLISNISKLKPTNENYVVTDDLQFIIQQILEAKRDMENLHGGSRKLAKRTRKSHTLYGGTHKKNHKKHTHKRKKRRN
jgi:hypothetical protein